MGNRPEEQSRALRLDNCSIMAVTRFHLHSSCWEFVRLPNLNRLKFLSFSQDVWECFGPRTGWSITQEFYKQVSVNLALHKQSIL